MAKSIDIDNELCDLTQKICLLKTFAPKIFQYISEGGGC